MSKGNMLQGQARGKVGDLVFYVRQGSQQTRVRNRQPANPRTLSTMLQRVKLASVVGFYKRQASFFKFALKKSAKESYYNAFVRYNLNIAPYLTKEQAALGFQVPAPYIISDGDMPQIGVSAVSVDVDNRLSLSSSIKSSLKTWGEMRRAYGLLMGDMLSVVIFNRGTLSTDQTNRIVIQHVFDQESEDMPIGYDMVGTSWDDLTPVWSLIIDKSYFGVSEWYAVGAAIITSRNANGVDCSYAQLSLSENAQALYLTYRSEEQHQEAAASYGSTQDAILDPNSFEGNYVDMVKLYNDSAHTSPVSDLVMFNNATKILYADFSNFPGIDTYAYEQRGDDQVLASLVADIRPGIVTLTCDDEVTGKSPIEITWMNENNVAIARSLFNVTTNAPA